MDAYDAHNHSFIIKIWREETSLRGGRATWRGHITAIPDGQRSYLRSLDDVPLSMLPYLEQMGVPIGITWRLRRRLHGWGRALLRRRRSTP